MTSVDSQNVVTILAYYRDLLPLNIPHTICAFQTLTLCSLIR